MACAFSVMLNCGRICRGYVQDPGTLFNNYLWNGARLISDYLQRNPDGCKGKSVLELGAAAAVPSMVAATLGTRLVVATDYPDPNILKIMQENINVNAALFADGCKPPIVQGNCDC